MSLGSQIAAQVIADVILADQAKNKDTIVEITADEADTRLRIFYLYQMLLTQSDEEHPLSTKQITDRIDGTAPHSCAPNHCAKRYRSSESSRSGYRR